MDFQSKRLQLQYEGYARTPNLWKGELLGLTQFELQKTLISQFSEQMPIQLRLGKRVERFVTNEIKSHDHIEILLENIQIFEEKRTLGELDLLLLNHGKPFHIEIVYKYYLYDPTVGKSELEHWIGPNRRDSLIQKMSKIKTKQLPLLHRKQSEIVLNRLGLLSNQFEQAILFKAQLFVPLNLLNDTFQDLNPDCLTGFYINHEEIEQFENCKFFIPDKIDWLMDVQRQVEWLNLATFRIKLKPLMLNFTAPLCWIKHPNGIMEKCFVTWWS